MAKTKQEVPKLINDADKLHEQVTQQYNELLKYIKEIKAMLAKEAERTAKENTWRL